MWKNRGSIETPWRELPTPNTIRMESKYSGEAPSSGFALVRRIGGFPTLKRVRLNGEGVDPTIYKDNCSTYVSIDIHPSGKEEYELLIEF